MKEQGYYLKNIHDDMFGLCPVCKEAGVRAIDMHRVMVVCKRHKLMWESDYGRWTPPICSGDVEWPHSALLMAECREVQPFYWPDRPGI